MTPMKYITTEMVLQEYPFTRGQLEYFLLYRHRNGLDRAVIKIGKRLYFIREALEDWIESYKEL